MYTRTILKFTLACMHAVSHVYAHSNACVRPCRYVNKAAMFGRIVHENTRVIVAGTVRKSYCGGYYDRNITTYAEFVFTD